MLKAVKTTTAKATGTYYEKQACQLLRQSGYTIIATNWIQAGIGEIDIIARQQRQLPTGKQHFTLVCVEVKARRRTHYGQAVEQVTIAKQQKLIKTVECFLMANPQYNKDDIRFDVIGFEMIEGRMQTHWINHAFLANV